MLRRKMLRDIWKNKSQFLTIFLMIALGLFAYVGIEAYMLGMEISANNFYENNNLQDIDIYGSFTSDDLKEVKKIAHVNDAELKLTLPASVDDDHDLEINFINENNISKFYVESGDNFDNKSGVWIDSYYAEQNNLGIGDKIDFSYGGFDFSEKIRGIIYVPDHIYFVKDAAAIYPNHESYGIAYLAKSSIDLDVYSSIMVDVDDEANRDYVKSEIDRILENATASTIITDSASYTVYQGEIDEGRSIVGIFSGFFILIAVLCVVTTMTRIVKQDRTKIGTLKALGFSNSKIARHYISYGLFLAIIGGAIGAVAGFFTMGNLFMGMEMEYFEVPDWSTHVDYTVLIVYLSVILAICLACYLVCRSLVRQNAAEILHIDRPKVNRRSLGFSSGRVFNKLGFASRWNLRDVFRSKGRVLTSIIGIAGCMILLVCGFGMYDTMTNYLNNTIDTINNYKYRLSLDSDISTTDLDNLYDNYSNHSSKTLAIEIKNDGQIKTNSLFIDNSKGNIKFFDENDKEFSLKDNGIYVTRKLAKTEGYQIGDQITWHVYGDDEYHTSEIVGLNHDSTNQNLSMSKKYYESLGYDYIPDSVYLDEKPIEDKIDGVSNIQSIDSIKDSFEQMTSTMITVIGMLAVIAALLGAVIIWNMGILSFSEKDYQFATLKVLGFSDQKIARIFILQNIWIAIAAIIIGTPLGYLLNIYIFTSVIDESYDVNIYIKFTTYVLSIVSVFALTVIVSKFLTRRVKKIDMVKSLKMSE